MLIQDIPVTNGNRVQQIQWSPDGTSLFATCENRRSMMYMLQTNDKNDKFNRYSDTVQLNWTCFHAERVYSSCWHPLTQWSDQNHGLLILSEKEHPISLLSTRSSKKLGSYPLKVGHSETYKTAYSMAFDSTGQNFIAGTDCYISLFDTQNIGDVPLYSVNLFKDSFSRIKGIVSALAYQTQSFAKPLVAAGTFTSSIVILDTRLARSVISIQAIPENRGITQLIFNDKQVIVFSRRSNAIKIYDVRNGECIDKISCSNATHQRLFGDLSCSKYLFYGDDRGYAYISDIKNPDMSPLMNLEAYPGDNGVTSAVFHPNRNILATSNGSRTSDTNDICTIKLWDCEGIISDCSGVES